MARPKKTESTEEMVTIPKSQMDDLMKRFDVLEQRVAKGGKQGIETSVHRLLNKPQDHEPDHMEAEDKIQVVDEPATKDGKMIKDACPYCKKFHPGKKTILDLMTNSGKYACRRCGKHWNLWAIKESEVSGELYPYTEALERGDKKRVEYQERLKMAKQGAPVALLEGEDDNS